MLGAGLFIYKKRAGGKEEGGEEVSTMYKFVRRHLKSSNHLLHFTLCNASVDKTLKVKSEVTFGRKTNI